MEWLAVSWFILLVLFVVIEASTVALVSVWFAVGSLGAMVAALFGAEIWLQAVLFTVVSCVLFACLRPFLRKYIRPRITKTNTDAIIGTTGRVLETVDDLQGTGRVKLGGLEWTARSGEGIVIPVGTLVKAERIEGVKVFVKEV